MENEQKKFRSMLRRSMPPDIAPMLTGEQMERLKSVSSVVLGVLGIAGLLTVAAVAPNALQAVDKFLLKTGRRGLTRKEREQKVIRAFYYLKEHGLILMRPTKDDVKIFLTGAGRQRLRKFNIENPVVPKPARWNKKWWLAAADIPTRKYKLAADAFRQKLKQMGFFGLQRTLWIYPFDPRREVEMLANYYRIEHFVTMMEINRLDLDDEASVKRYFRRERIIQ